MSDFPTDPAEPLDVWQLATPLHLLRLLKLLGEDGRKIAAQIGSHAPLVSMWLREKRPIPEHYHAPLLAWARTVWVQARDRHHKDTQALPTDDLKRAAIETFYAPVNEWIIRVKYEAGSLQHALQREAGMLATYTAHTPLTPGDCESIKTVCQVMLQQVALIEALEAESPGCAALAAAPAGSEPEG